MNKKSKSTLEKFEKSLRFKNYADNSIKTYKHYVEVFLSSFSKDVYHISQKEAVKWLKDYNYTSISMQNQIISSIKLLYKYVLNVKLNNINIERPRKKKTLPKVIDKELLLNKIFSIENRKHKAILALGYSVGLRVSEVVNLKIGDIDSDRMIIHIKNAKGNKDRIVPLSDNLLIILREYYSKYRPTMYLFNGQFDLKYTASSCNKLVKKYLGNHYHFHMLRHSSFTSMLESGTDISIIQKIAGHMKTDTTRIYAQVSNQLLKTANVPI